MDIKAKNFIILFSVSAILLAIFFVFYFFLQLNSTAFVMSSGDVTVYLQSYYNFYNGRPFQNTTATECASFINPYPYINILVWHSYFLTSVVISAVYYFFPDINTLFLFYILFDYIGIAYFTYKILKILSFSDYKLKTLLAVSIFAISGYLRIIVANGIPSQIVGPFILAAYYFLIDNKKLPFIITTILICLIQDDLALFIITFALYIIIFEKQYRSYVYIPAVFAVIYFGVWSLLCQPAIRHDFINHHSSQLLFRLSAIKSIDPIIEMFRQPIRATASIFAPAMLYIVSGCIFYFYFDRMKKMYWLKILGLALIAPFFHFAYTVYTYADRHATVMFTIDYLILILFISNINFNIKLKSNIPLYIYLNSVFFSFIIINFLYLGGLPYTLKNHTYWADKVETLVKSFGIDLYLKRNNIEKERVSNKFVIDAMKKIPIQSSVVYWTNDTLEGFIVNRNDIWRFPMYYDLADYLIIQTDATSSIYQVKTKDDLNYKIPGVQDKQAYNFERDWSIPKSIVDEIKDDLVNKLKTHSVKYEGEHLLIIERINKYNFFMPESSLGLGWIKYIKMYTL
ncbi:MAG: DUF2079 domain-containing protein [Nitrospirota bacterium]